MTETFPPKWKRVRYSENFPKLPPHAVDLSVILRSAADWKKVDFIPVTWEADNDMIYQMARHRIGRVRVRIG